MAANWQVRTLVLLSLVFNALAAITRYIPEGQETLFGIQPSSTTTDTSPASTFTGSAAYDPRTLVPPTPPTDPPVNTRFPVQLLNGGMTNLSIPQNGAFLGFSIEFSVSSHVCEFSLGFYTRSNVMFLPNRSQWATTGTICLVLILDLLC